ncbi:nuclear transport factor 2 family protein [Solimonas soli]|uniref:nuclear transport factor 2 family protein n=1 Tax=Solimonas soli TaxID=413479 RepID=UPI0004BABFA1|nr:nuclear transport factor 2 family protein [Solimonas soli]
MDKTLEQRVQALEDQQAIVRLKARYVNLNDGGWGGVGTHRFAAEVADMFVEDGVWDGRPNAGYAEGRDGIRELFERFTAVPFIVHYVTNPLIEVDGDAATGHWHVLVTATMPDREALWTLGTYAEQYVRTAQGWKFKTLRFVAAANTTYALGWGKKQFAFGEQGFSEIAMPGAAAR